MKFRKVLSVLCAVTMLTSTLPAASAAEAESLSEYAGGTVICQVYEMTGEGLAAVTYNVPIPAAATKEVEKEIVRNYVLTAGDSRTVQTRGYNAYEEISVKSNVRVVTAATNVGSGKAANSYDQVYVEFAGMVNHGATELKVQVENWNLGIKAEKALDFSSTAVNYVYFLLSDKTPFFVNAGNTVNTTARTDNGYVTATTCTVLGA